MEKVKKQIGCPNAHAAHQSAWYTMEQEVLKFVRAGDTEGLKAFVQKYTESNSLLEVGLTARNSSEMPLKDVRVQGFKANKIIFYFARLVYVGTLCCVGQSHAPTFVAYCEYGYSQQILQYSLL